MLLCLALAVPAKAVAQQPAAGDARPTGRPEAPRPDAPARPADRGAQVRRPGHRHRLPRRTETGQRAGHRQPDLGPDHRVGAVRQLRRAAARGARHERHADVGAGHQPGVALGHRHAVDVAARPHRRPLDLSGLLRLRRLGLPPGEHQRDQTDRSDSRTGVGRVGRQRAHRRGQRDHQVAARDPRREPDRDRRHVRPRRQRRRAIERFAVLRLGQPCGRAVRHGGLQDHRRLLDAGGARPAQRADPERHQHALSRLREHRHQPAEAGRPRRLRLPRQGEQAGVRRRLRRHGRDDPHRHRPLRHRSRHLPRLRQGQLQPRRDAGQRVRQPSRRRRHQPPVARHHRHVHPVLVQEHDLRRRGERHPHLAQHARLQLRRQRPLQQLRSVARPARRFADGSRRLRPGRVVHLRALPRRHRRPRRQVLVDLRSRVLAADHVHVQAVGVADGARVVQSRLPRAVARQQLPRRDAGQRARSRRPQSGPGRPAVHLPERGDRQSRT